MNLNRIALFVRVADARSFSAAARALAMPTSSVSRAVAHLESDLGVRLLNRTTRKLSLTDAGQRYYALVRGALGAIEEANAAASESSREPRGTIRVTIPADFSSPFFMTLLARFLAQYPQVRIEVMLTNRRVNLTEEGVDLALRAGALDDSSAMAKRLGDTEFGLYAAQSYVKRNGAPKTLGQLSRFECVMFRATGIARWRLTGPRGDEEVEVTGRIVLDALNGVRAAVVAGLGIGMLPTSVLPGEPTSDGALVRVLPRYVMRGGPLSLVWPSSRFLARHVAVFRDFMAEQLASVTRMAPRRSG